MIGVSKGRILGIDYGTRRIGIAICDPLRVIAQGVGTFGNDADIMTRIRALVEKREVSRVVVGMPYDGEGGIGKKGPEVLEFIEKLSVILTVPIETWDESFTSVEARRVFIDGGMKRKTRAQKGRIDEMAARLMLQDYLDHHLA